MLPDATVTVLGRDPAHRRFNINCNAFQQDAIVSFRGWQYCCFYSFLQSEPSRADPEPLYVHLARRELPQGEWEVMVLRDYPQTTDDGHNTVQMGICPGDGTIHLAFDHHCDVLHYRASIPNLASRPTDFQWSPSLFAPTINHLPGLAPTHPHFHYVTYPRFGTLSNTTTNNNTNDNGSMFCTLRDGKAGLGDDYLYTYNPQTSHFHFLGALLTGIKSSPYVHGITHRASTLHATWVYRGFVHYDGWDDLSDTKHKQQAGPNGAENNYDICYAYSEDAGRTWRNGGGRVVADLTRGETIGNDAEGIVAFEIPKGSGLMNQEAQAVDGEGGVHVLNRDGLGGGGGGRVMWKHYYREPGGTWTQRVVRPVSGSARGRLAVSKTGDLYILLPDFAASEMRILKATRASGYASYDEVWTGRGLTGEPLVDEARLEHDNVLSVLVLAEQRGMTGGRDVAVLDFQL